MHPIKTQTNQANAQHSTGPRTPEGKRRSSLNAVRHALTGLTVVLPTDDLDAYRRFIQSFHAELRPQGVQEQAAAQAIADTHWRLNRIRALENNLFANAFAEFAPGIATDDETVRAALAQAKALEVHAGVLTKLSLYEQRLTRTLERAQAELTRLQQARKWREHNNLQQTPPPSPKIEKTNPPAPPSDSPSASPTPTADAPAANPEPQSQPEPHFRAATARERT